MQRIRKGDEVQVRTGRDKGKRGNVVRVVDEDRVLVEGINIVKKHVRANPNAGTAGGIIDQEMPIHISNIAIYNPVTGKGDRVGFKRLEDGRKVRYFKSNGEVIDI